MPYLPNSIQVEIPELPGRGRRSGESLIRQRLPAVKDLLAQLKSKRNGQPYVIYGHSLGALLGFHLAKEMEALKDAPMYFITTGNTGPGRKPRYQRHLLPKHEFLKEVKKLGGISDAILQSGELVDFFEPVLRADFEIAEEDSNTITQSALMHTPIIALMGDQEEDADDIENWRSYTTAGFQSIVLPGNHFFIYDHVQRLSAIIKNCYDGVKAF